MAAAASTWPRWLGVTLLLTACHGAPAAGGPQRLVSLSPSITETLFALGAGELVTGVTDFDDYPPEVKQRTRAGSMLQPNYEAIARLHPTLVLGERVGSSETEKLGAIAPTKVLPWLSVADVIASTRELGRITHHDTEAEHLVTQLESKLHRTPPASAPRVLLVIPGTPGPMTEVWYVKHDSLHGAALESAGGRNAIADSATGAPVLSLERLLTVDPDVVVLLIPDDALSDATREQYLSAWRSLSTLKAVKSNAVRVLAGTEVQSTGPRILHVVDRLSALLHEFEGKQ